MSEVETEDCSICIENLDLTQAVAQIRCGHRYHDSCLKQWCLQTNSCPTCRGKFNKVNLVGQDGFNIYEYEVEDKVFEGRTDALVPLRQNNSNNLQDRVCVLCSSIRDSIFSNCGSCSSSFHRECLGLSESFSGEWNCPMCDTLQERNYARPRSWRRTVPTPPVQVTQTRVRTEILGTSSERQISRRSSENSRRTESTYQRLTLANRLQGNTGHISQSLVETSEQRSNQRNSGDPLVDDAWREFELVRRNNNRQNNRNSYSASNSSSNTTTNSSPVSRRTYSPSTSAAASSEPQTKKLKRPSRRRGVNNKVNNVASTSNNNTNNISKASVSNSSSPSSSSPSSSSSSSSPPQSSTVLSLLTEMHATSERIRLQQSQLQLRNSSRVQQFDIGNLSNSSVINSRLGQWSPPLSPDSNETTDNVDRKRAQGSDK